MGMDFKGMSTEAKDYEARVYQYESRGKILGLLLKLVQLKVPRVYLTCWLRGCEKLPC